MVQYPDEIYFGGSRTRIKIADHAIRAGDVQMIIPGSHQRSAYGNFDSRVSLLSHSNENSACYGRKDEQNVQGARRSNYVSSSQPIEFVSTSAIQCQSRAKTQKERCRIKKISSKMHTRRT